MKSKDGISSDLSFPRRGRSRPWIRRLLVVSCLASTCSKNQGRSSNVWFPACDALCTNPTESIQLVGRIPQGLRAGRTRKRSEITTLNFSSFPVSKTSATLVRSSSSSSNHAERKRVDGGAELVGLVFALGIILSLAGMSGSENSNVLLVGDGNEVASSSVAVVTKVVENTVPTTSTEVVAVTLGESIGGVIGAAFSVAINFLLLGGKQQKLESPEQTDETKTTTTNKGTQPSVFYQGLSDGDYFIAKSASNSFLEAVGVPETIAKYSSILIGAIPSQLVKIGSRISEQRRFQEEELLNQLFLEEQRRKEKRRQSGPFSFLQKRNRPKTNERFVDPKELVPVRLSEGGSSAPVTRVGVAAATSGSATSFFVIDFVEIFADVTRWLEYDVLKAEYGEAAASQLWMEPNGALINPLQSAITYALLGSLAAVSSRWYADVLYGRFRYGPVEKQEAVRLRNNAEWFSLYSSTAASSAALFGCYEFFQLPIGRYIQGTLSGGVEGCFGSSRFDACMQTFIDTNAPGPSSEAQLRALFTNLYAVYVRLGDIAGDTTTQDVSALIRAWSVSFASYLANLQ